MILKPPTETEIQKALLRWCGANAKKYPELDLLFHIPNGANKSFAGGKLFKLMGQKAGVPDLFLPVARSGFHGLWIELKTKKGVVRPEQKRWLEALARQGYAVEVCRCWEVAADILRNYLRGKYNDKTD